jgi:uncharacterized protein (UPF0332 family)
MRIVGDHLAEIAAKSGDATRFDLFGRSAFNRYYYSAFLAVRAALRKIDSKWTTPSHQAVPEVLKGEVLTRIKRQIRTSQRTGQISANEGFHLLRAAQTATSELSNLLSSARETRRIADYEPEQLVQRAGSVVTLAECSLDTAKYWERRVDMHAKTILRVYGHLGLF